MIDYFNADQFQADFGCPHRCGGCRKFWHRCTHFPPALLAEFQSITGLDWKSLTQNSGPEGRLVSVPLRKDYFTLGLDTQDVPEVMFLCLPCIVDYMKTFNRLSGKRHGPTAEYGLDRPSP